MYVDSYAKFSLCCIACLFAARHHEISSSQEIEMLSTVLWVVLILALIGALPTWPYSTNWGYYPSGGLGLILVILLVLALTGK
jgi:hypothetical protein